MIIDDSYQFHNEPTAYTFRFYLKNELMDNGNLINPHFSKELAYSYLPQHHKAECWCVTHQRPRVEYKVILLPEFEQFEQLVNEAAQEGWKLMPTAINNFEIATMWRWAE